MIIFQRLPYLQLYLNNSNTLFFDPAEIEGSEEMALKVQEISKKNDKLLLMLSSELSEITIPPKLVIQYVKDFGVNLVFVHSFALVDFMIREGIGKSRMVFVPADYESVATSFIYDFDYIATSPKHKPKLIENLYNDKKLIYLNAKREQIRDLIKRNYWACVLESNVVEHKHRWRKLDESKYESITGTRIKKVKE